MVIEDRDYRLQLQREARPSPASPGNTVNYVDYLGKLDLGAGRGEGANADFPKSPTFPFLHS